MPLIKKVLEEALDLMKKDMPLTAQDAADRWSAMFVSYYKTAGLFGFDMSMTLKSDILKNKFLVSLNAGTFMKDLGNNLQSWLEVSLWSDTGKTFTGKNIISIPLLSEDVGNEILKKTVDEFSKYLSDEIEKWSRTIQIAVTNISTGSVSVTRIF